MPGPYFILSVLKINDGKDKSEEGEDNGVIFFFKRLY